MNKIPFELSIWQDLPELGERKLAVLASDTMDTPNMAYDVILKEKINGQKDLTFSILYKCPSKNGDLVDNELFNLLGNEKLVKLRRGAPYPIPTFGENDDVAQVINSFKNEEDIEDKWIDFSIKKITKDSSKHIATVEASEIYVTELGRNGWSQVFDIEKENNYGTLTELATQALTETDWEVDDDSYKPVEFTETPVVCASLAAGTQLQLKSAINGAAPIITVTDNKKFYLFYQSLDVVTDEENNPVGWRLKPDLKELQVLYAPDGAWAGDALIDYSNLLPIDDDGVIIDDGFSYNYWADNFDTIKDNFQILKIINVSGKEIKKSQRQKLEHTTDKYVKIYEPNALSDGHEIYSYTQIDYSAKDFSFNYLVNSENFTSNSSWAVKRGDEYNKDDFYPDPSIAYIKTYVNGDDQVDTPFSVLNLRDSDGGSTGEFYNDGPRYQKMDAVAGEQYSLQIEFGQIDGQNFVPLASAPTDLHFWLEARDDDFNYNPISNIITTFARHEYAPAMEVNARVVYTANFDINATTFFAHGNYIRLMVDASNASTAYAIRSIYLVKNIEDHLYIDPEATREIIDEKEVFYYVDDNEAIYLDPNASYTPLYSEGYESVRNISVKQSNYFNILQTLAETFNVWVGFKIGHYKDGRVLIENGRRKKIVKFSQFSPYDRENHAGFIYGTNLSSIKREVTSDAITTKTIVQNNSQEYATDGACSITRATDNPSGENVIYNFDYFISQGMLERNTILRDFYGILNDDFKYYPKVKALNNQYRAASHLLIDADNGLKIWQANVELYESARASAEEELAKINFDILLYTGIEDISDIEDDDPRLDGIEDRWAARKSILASAAGYDSLYNQAVSCRNNYQNKVDELSNEIDEILSKKTSLNQELYVRYSRFIQEGTWNDDAYIDDNLYYYDAQKIANISAFPKIKYTINAIDFEGSEDENLQKFTFGIGDRTFIQDPEFFGYKIVTAGGVSISTPRRIDAIISERQTNFSDPSKTSITVQNYKNQYDELFQNIQASVQTLQYEKGTYARAAGVVMQDGAISVESLEKAFANNAIQLANSSSFDIDINTENGIELTTPQASNLKVKIVPAGIFCSADGGQNWTSGITGRGINASTITTGALNAGLINIVSPAIGDANSMPALFKWGDTGITAFRYHIKDPDSSTDTSHVDPNSYVKFNQYGVYCVNNNNTIERYIKDASHSYDDCVDYIKNNSTFSLTHEGLVLNSQSYQEDTLTLSQAGGLQIFPGWKFTEEFLNNNSPLNELGELYVTDDLIPALVVGRYYMDNGDIAYGIRLRNNGGDETLGADDVGKLWTKDTIGVKGNGYYSALSAPLVNFEIEDDAKGEIILWAGVQPNTTFPADEDIVNAPFKVTNTGFLYAQNAYIEGIINATSGSFAGNITAESGLISGILYIGEDETAGICGSQSHSIENNPVLMWAGTDQFYIKTNGELHATGAILEGDITVANGNITNILTIGNNSGIGPNGADGKYLWINNDKFYVTSDGVATFDSAVLNGHLEINVSGRTVGINDVDKGYAFYSAAFVDEEEVADFYVNNEGEVFARNLKIAGEAQVTERLNVGNITLDSSNGGTINNGSHWSINGDGTAKFENADIRGVLSTTTWKKDSVSAVGGSLMISTSLILEEDEEGQYAGQDPTSGTILYRYNFDSICEGEGSNWGSVQKITLDIPGQETPISAMIEGDDQSGKYFLLENSSLYKGTIIINTLADSAYIKLQANSDDNGPLIEMRAEDGSILLIGNLNNRLEGTRFNVDEPGYGFYAKNAYLDGRLYLPGAGITDEVDKKFGEDNSPIRIWAGEAPEKRDEAPFIVTEDGSLYATKGIFKGRIVAEDSEFSGWLKTAGILIKENSAPEDAHNDTFYVSYEGADPYAIDNKVLEINKNGISIWEGGFNVFSDYAAGWRDGVKTGTPDYTGYDYRADAQSQNLNPFPYIRAIDAEDYRLYMTRVNIADLSSGSGVGIKDGFINFYNFALSGEDFLSREAQLWGSAENAQLKIGLITDAGNKKLLRLGPDSIFTTYANELVAPISKISIRQEIGKTIIENREEGGVDIYIS